MPFEEVNTSKVFNSVKFEKGRKTDQGITLMSFQSKKLHNFKALLKTMGVTSLITCAEKLRHG